MVIKFGTDGWRAILNEDFTKENVKRVTLAIGKYVYDTFGYDKRIIVGYDPRKMADIYAKYCAELLCKKGFTVELSCRIVPTPILAYNAKAKNAVAIMFTASHNPPEYLGMKFIPDYAGPATSEITDKIIDNLDLDFPTENNGSISNVDFATDYYKHIEKLVNFEKIKKIKTKIIYDGLHSASIGYFDTILDKHGIQYETMNMEHDPNFGGKMPDPKPKYLGDLIEKIKSTVNAIGVANDGDADRFGVINEDGEYVSPNEIIAILLKYLSERGMKGSVIKTVGSSILIDNIANKLGINIIETAVGFKHVGEAMRKNDFIIGGEESGGLSIQGHIPEKDGLIANLLVMEAMSHYGKKLTELQQDIYKLGGKFYTDRMDLRLENQAQTTIILDKFKTISKLGNFNVSNVDLKDGVKLMFGQNSKILVRPSGTEPLLRIYFESNNENTLTKLQEEVQKNLDN